MNLLLSIVNNYTEASPAYQVRHWNSLAKIYGFQFVAFISNGALQSLDPYVNELTNVTFIKMSDYPDDLRDLFTENTYTLQLKINQIVENFKPAKITCNMDFMLFKYIEKYQCKKQIFVRQFFNKIHQVMLSHPRLLLNNIELEKSAISSLEELRCLKQADLIITNNNLSGENIKKHLNLDSLVIPQYRNPEPFLNRSISSPNFLTKKYYHIGRTDHIKNVAILQPNKYSLLLIGNNLISNELQSLPNTTHINKFCSVDIWYDLVKDIPISVNPCIYETNGFGVQESLMMGKITLVQRNSGGNLLHIVDGVNGIVVDFENHNYEDILESMSLEELKRMSDYARQTIDCSLYQKSLDQYVQQII
jgi:glycosyltransferase involved in cell wall biosynthesis